MVRQWLGRLGKTDNGIVTVTTVWTDGRICYPLHAQPYTPAHHFTRGRFDPSFRTKPQLSATLAARGKEAGFGCRAVVADCAYSVSDDWYPVERHFCDGPHRHLVGRACPFGWLRTRLSLPPVRGHHRPLAPAGEGHLVPGYQPAPPRRTPPGHRPAPAGRPRRDRPPLRTAAADRAATRPSSTAPSPPAGTNGSPHPDPWMPPPHSTRPPELQDLINAGTTGRGIDLYCRN
ncbi:MULTISPECIES: transposase [unclassified Streptomyces]|uniref:transposase n=1 Tax=unclassified Streptomyces TaxID=2593676 RepID=UPI0036E214C8